MEITLNEVLYTLITCALMIVVRFGVQLIRTKTAEIKNTEVQQVIDNIGDIVIMVSQTFVDSLKESGNFDKEAQAKAFDMAKTAALNGMSDSMKKYIDKYCGGLDEWLRIQIEAWVKKNKIEEIAAKG
nr:MAG TPA: hypothetical protein [Caudoviricetes sp.]